MEEVRKITSSGVFPRVDRFLVSQFSDYSRTYFQGLISTGMVKLNDQVVSRPSIAIKEGDNLEVIFPEDTLDYEIVPQKVDYEVVHTHPDFLIINKPAGLIVHHAKSNAGLETLTAGLLYSFKEMADFEDKERPGIVHRIDKDTSGLLIVARNQKSRMKLSTLFKDRKVSKTYLAVVNGHPPKEGKIDFSIGRHPVHRHKMSHKSMVGKSALTYYKVLAYYEDCSLVEAKIVTGRTHQIRVHFAAISHGLLGDSMYGVSSKLIKRQALHAWKVSFEYDGSHSFINPIPSDMQRLLKNVSSASKF